MTSVCLSRLRKEYIDLKKRPVENIRAAPRETNTLEWHYVLEGPKGSPYEGGFYHGIVTFPSEYPHKPPRIEMNTPNGRFQTCTRLCLSISDFHPETWNPLWSVSSILLGLQSFMQDTQSTYGSINTSASQKKQFAQSSLEFNVKNSKIFCEMFPELVELYEERKAMKPPDAVPVSDAQSTNSITESNPKSTSPVQTYFAFALLAAVVGILWMLL